MGKQQVAGGFDDDVIEVSDGLMSLAKTSIDLTTADVENIDSPASWIRKTLRCVGSDYKKREEDAYAICDRLNYETLYLDGASRSSAFAQFLKAIEFCISDCGGPAGGACGGAVFRRKR
jgi:hypothetical protein